MKKILLAICLMFAFGCTENSPAARWGGTMTIDLPCNQKLFDVTWKNSDFWYATRLMRPSDVPESYRFQEDSQWGLVEGTVIISESRCGK